MSQLACHRQPLATHFLALKRAAIAGLVCLLAAGNAFAEDAPELSFEAVAPGVYFYEGDIVEFFESPYGFAANVSFIVGEQAIAVVDAGASYAEGQLILEAIRKVSDLPVRYLIHTHAHLDHMFGAKAFLDDDIEIIAHEQYQRELVAKGPYFLARLDKPWFAGTELVEPTRLIDQDITIDLGNRPLRIQTHARAHTNNDISVYDEITDTWISGDLLFVTHCPSLEGDVLGWAAELAKVEAQAPRLILPGHGPAQHDTKAVRKLRLYLERLAREVRLAIEDFVDISTAAKTIMTDERDQWALFDDFHPRNVLQAYKQLEWE